MTQVTPSPAASGDAPGCELPADPLRAVEQALVTFELFSAMRHDLRNKLAPMRNVVAYVRKQIRDTDIFKSDARLGKFLELIETEVAAANALLESPPGMERAFVREVVVTSARSCVALALGSLRGGGRARIVTVGKDEDPGLEIDPRELAVALRGLLENALEKDAGEVRLTVERRERAVAFEVLDHGPGLGTEELAAAVEGRAPQRSGHVGLSLAVAARVARRYGGSLALVPGTTGTLLSLTVVGRSA